MLAIAQKQRLLVRSLQQALPYALHQRGGVSLQGAFPPRSRGRRRRRARRNCRRLRRRARRQRRRIRGCRQRRPLRPGRTFAALQPQLLLDELQRLVTVTHDALEQSGRSLAARVPNQLLERHLEQALRSGDKHGRGNCPGYRNFFPVLFGEPAHSLRGFLDAAADRPEKSLEENPPPAKARTDCRLRLYPVRPGEASASTLFPLPNADDSARGCAPASPGARRPATARRRPCRSGK